MVVILFTVALISILVMAFFLKKNKEDNLGWRFRKIGEGQLQYSQEYDNLWESITFNLVLYADDVPRHKIEVPNDWSSFPEWAQHEKETILNRLKKEFRPPQYTIVEVKE